MVWRNREDSRELEVKKETAGFIGITALSSAIVVLDVTINGGTPASAGAGGISIISLWHIMNLQRDKKKSAFDED
ncbi:MAG: hypothetical protein KGH54_00795 [Candidatus Micrarchaeota archaeon]|nr:hypothetical protein [Candidatus Micrarchaeota archaeon]